MKVVICLAVAAFCGVASAELGPCHRELKSLTSMIARPGMHVPKCLADGTYAPLQCREAVCMCVDSEGKSTGHENSVGVAYKMSCQCARAKAEFQKTGMVGLTYSCDELGNFNPVQCVGSMCQCVDTTSGVKLEAVEAVHVSQISTLSCNQDKRQAVEQGACARELAMIEEGPVMLGQRKPVCREDGSYHPRQCFGSVCTCVDSKGKPTDVSAHISQAADMNCECARKQADYQRKGMVGLVGLTYSCDALGNYNAVQCIGSVCHCVDTVGQRLEAIEAVPIHLVSTLNCAQDKRQAVEQGACAREVELIKADGPMRLGRHKPQCLEDGSYHPRQCREAVCSCVDSQGKPTGHSANVGYAYKMSCQCARDQADFKSTGMVGLTYSCDELGNYNPIQCIGSVCHCVDNNGKKLEAVAPVSIGNIRDLHC